MDGHSIGTRGMSQLQNMPLNDVSVDITKVFDVYVEDAYGGDWRWWS
jgi:hypothetical protein